MLTREIYQVLLKQYFRFTGKQLGTANDEDDTNGYAENDGDYPNCDAGRAGAAHKFVSFFFHANLLLKKYLH